MRGHPQRMKEEEETRAEELRYGQIVIVTARWALVLMGLLLLIWRPGDLRGFTIGILVVLALAVVNFFLHVQILRDRPMRYCQMLWMKVVCPWRDGAAEESVSGRPWLISMRLF